MTAFDDRCPTCGVRFLQHNLNLGDAAPDHLFGRPRALAALHQEPNPALRELDRLLDIRIEEATAFERTDRVAAFRAVKDDIRALAARQDEPSPALTHSGQPCDPSEAAAIAQWEPDEGPLDIEPDSSCVTLGNGDCVSTDPRDMHAPLDQSPPSRLFTADRALNLPHREDDEPCGCDECMYEAGEANGVDWYSETSARRIALRVLDSGDDRFAPLVTAIREHDEELARQDEPSPALRPFACPLCRVGIAQQEPDLHLTGECGCECHAGRDPKFMERACPSCGEAVIAGAHWNDQARRYDCGRSDGPRKAPK